MGKHHASVDVADSIYARHVGCHILVGGNATTHVVLHTCSLKVKPVNVWLAASGYKHHVGFKAFLFALALVANGTVGDALHCGLHDEVDASFLKQFASALSDVGIHCRQAFFEKFHHSDFHAEAIEDRRKLHAYNASTNDNEVLRQLWQRKQLGRSHHSRHCARTDGVGGEQFVGQSWREF